MSSYIALDIGEKRIGVALCDAQTPFPAPLTTLVASRQLAAEVASLLRRHKVVGVVVGYPRNQQGEITPQTKRVEHIVGLLNIPREIPVYFQDESLTSVKAEEELRRRKKPYEKADVDALAATLILEDFVQQQLPQLRAVASTAAASPHSPQRKEHNKPHKQTKEKSQQTKLGSVSKKLRSFHFIALTFIVAAGILLSGMLLWYRQNLQPVTEQEQYQVVTIPPGSTTTTIADILTKERVIRNKTTFLIYARLHKKTTIQAGSYRLSGHQPVPEIVDTLAGGKVTTINILIAPGLRVDQIVEKLVSYGYEEQEVYAAIEELRTHPLLKNVAKNRPIEGYIFPDTYQAAPETTATQLLKTTLDTFQNRMQQYPDIESGLARQQIAFEDAVIIASIVQMEVPDYETQKKVAQVFIKRYKEGMPLGADPTFKYAAAMTNQASVPSIDSPYNTRRYSGLPPTAIANFTIDALRAVANPSATDYTYFVSGDDGITRFSHTLEEHERLTAQYCIELCR